MLLANSARSMAPGRDMAPGARQHKPRHPGAATALSMRPFNRDTLPHLVNCGLTLLRERRDTWLCRLLARWWGVRLGRGCRFCGRVVFRRLPGSAIRIGDRCTFRSAYWSNRVGLNRSCMISTLREGAVVEIGDDCGLSGTVIAAERSISIGSGVLCGGNVTVTDTDWHPLDRCARRRGEPGRSAPVVIGDDVWLGLNVTVLKGVRIGQGTVVGANSVVTGDLPDNVLAAGAPTRVIRSLADEDSIGPHGSCHRWWPGRALQPQLVSERRECSA